MEILKFDESGTSSPSRKRSGRGAILVTFVALVFGAGTALASGTLTINNPQNTIALDQGVANSVQCDDAINIVLNAPYDTDAGDFLLTGVTVSGIDISNSTEHCLNKDFTMKIYDEDGELQVFCNVYVPAVIDPVTDAVITPASGDEKCGDAGKSQTLQAVTGTSGTLNFRFTKGLQTGFEGFVYVKNVTVESSDHI